MSGANRKTGTVNKRHRLQTVKYGLPILAAVASFYGWFHNGSVPPPKPHDSQTVADQDANDVFRLSGRLTDEGMLLIDNGDLQRGLHIMEKAVLISSNVYSCSMLACEYERLGQYDLAMETYRKAVEISRPLAEEESASWTNPTKRVSNIPVFAPAYEYFLKQYERLKAGRVKLGSSGSGQAAP